MVILAEILIGHPKASNEICTVYGLPDETNEIKKMRVVSMLNEIKREGLEVIDYRLMDVFQSASGCAICGDTRENPNGWECIGCGSI